MLIVGGPPKPAPSFEELKQHPHSDTNARKVVCGSPTQDAERQCRHWSEDNEKLCFCLSVFLRIVKIQKMITEIGDSLPQPPLLREMARDALGVTGKPFGGVPFQLRRSGFSESFGSDHLAPCSGRVPIGCRSFFHRKVRATSQIHSDFFSAEILSHSPGVLRQTSL